MQIYKYKFYLVVTTLMLGCFLRTYPMLTLAENSVVMQDQDALGAAAAFGDVMHYTAIGIPIVAGIYDALPTNVNKIIAKHNAVPVSAEAQIFVNETLANIGITRTVQCFHSDGVFAQARPDAGVILITPGLSIFIAWKNLCRARLVDLQTNVPPQMVGFSIIENGAPLADANSTLQEVQAVADSIEKVVNRLRFIIQHEGMHLKQHSLALPLIGTSVLSETARQLYRNFFNIAEQTEAQHIQKMYSGFGIGLLSCACVIPYSRWQEQQADDGTQDDEAVLSGGIDEFTHEQNSRDDSMTQTPFGFLGESYFSNQSIVGRKFLYLLGLLDGCPRLRNLISQPYVARNAAFYPLLEFIYDYAHPTLQARIAKLQQRFATVRHRNSNMQLALESVRLDIDID